MDEERDRDMLNAVTRVENAYSDLMRRVRAEREIDPDFVFVSRLDGDLMRFRVLRRTISTIKDTW